MKCLTVLAILVAVGLRAGCEEPPVERTALEEARSTCGTWIKKPDNWNSLFVWLETQRREGATKGEVLMVWFGSCHTTIPDPEEQADCKTCLTAMINAIWD